MKNLINYKSLIKNKNMKLNYLSQIKRSNLNVLRVYL